MASENATSVEETVETMETEMVEVDIVAVENEIEKVIGADDEVQIVDEVKVEEAKVQEPEVDDEEEDDDAEYIVKDELDDDEESANKENGEKTEEPKEPEPVPEFKFAEEDQSKCTLFVSNLPRNVVSKDLEAVFGDVGPVKGCFVVASADTKRRGFGYVTFALRETAEKAIGSVASRGASKVFEEVLKKRKASDDVIDGGKEEPAKKKPVKKKKKGTQSEPMPDSGNKSARIIIRNVKFDAKEEEIRKAFTSFGDIEEIWYPKRKGGRPKGFCFIQFEKIIDAKNAIEQMNGRDFLGRNLNVEWPRNKMENDTKEKPGEEKDAKKKEDSDSKKGDKKEEKKDDGKKDGKKKNAKKKDDKKKDDKKDDDKKKDGKKDDKKKEEKTDDKKKKDEKPEEKNNVLEGRTLFLRHVPLDTTEQELYEAFCPFGQVQYAVICIDAYTESPTGTAVVEFVDKNDAEACLKKANGLAQDRGITVNNVKLEVRLAVNQDELEKRKEYKDRKHAKDSRNLHLAREGQIRPGTKEAEGVSASDMGKRLELQTWKNDTLKNLNMFISDKRLCVRNIPPSMRNKRLREIFEKAGGPGAKLTEVFIMRGDADKKKEADTPTKTFGFVTFTKHEHALAALRAVNNNPKYFSEEQRPIVEFSLENRATQKAKENSSRRNESAKKDDKPSFQGRTSDRLNSNRDRLQTNRDRPGTNRDRLGVKRDRPDASRDRLDSKRTRFDYDRDRSALGRDRLGANRDRSAVGRDRIGANRDRSAVGRDRIGANRDRMGAYDRRGNVDSSRQQQQRRGRNSPVRNNRQDRRGDRSRNDENYEEEVQPQLVLDQIRHFIDATGILGLESFDSLTKNARDQQRGRQRNW